MNELEMWSALKSDLLDFVNTIQSDTTNTLQKVLGEDETEQEVDQTLLKKLKSDVKRSYETYANPLKEHKLKEYEKYKKKFSLSSYGKEIAGILDEEPEVSRFYAELVPIEISPEEFWARLFFRLRLVNRNGSVTFEDDDEDEEELVWEDSEVVKEPAEIERQTELQIYVERIQRLESENSKLRLEVSNLQDRIQDLEAKLLQQSALCTVNEDKPVINPLINFTETASISSSEGSSLLILTNPAETILSSVEESDGEVQKKERTNDTGLASLDDEEDEDGWN